MGRHLFGLFGFAASAVLSYGLVAAFAVLPSDVPGSTSAAHQNSQSGPPIAPLPMSFRSDVTWHGDSLVTSDPRSTDCSVMGTRYLSSTGERAFLIRLEFGSGGAAQRALRRERGRAVDDEPFESGLGTLGRYFPQYHLHFDPKRESVYDTESEHERCDHAIVWLEGNHLLGVYGPNFDTVRALYIWTRTQPN